MVDLFNNLLTELNWDMMNLVDVCIEKISHLKRFYAESRIPFQMQLDTL